MRSYPFSDETPGRPVGLNTKVSSVPIENRHSLTTAFDLDQAAMRIRDYPDSNNRRPPVKSDDRMESNENNLSNGDLVANGSAPVVINGNSHVSAGSSHKDVSLGDIESRIPPGSPDHDSKRDTIITVDSEEPHTTKVRPCCPLFCYCESPCCTNYKESCIRKSWHGLRYYVCAFVEHKYFEWFILFMIVISSLTLVSFIAFSQAVKYPLFLCFGISVNCSQLGVFVYFVACLRQSSG